MEKTDIQPIEAEMTKEEMMKQFIRQKPVLTEEDLEAFIPKIEEFINNNKGRYFMLFNAENRYITWIDGVGLTTKSFVLRLLNFLLTDSWIHEAYGDLKHIEINEANEMIELWFGETFFAFFNGDSFAVKLKDDFAEYKFKGENK